MLNSGSISVRHRPFQCRLLALCYGFKPATVIKHLFSQLSFLFSFGIIVRSWIVFHPPPVDEVYMPDDRPKPDRPWREIAGEVANELDSDKVLELSQELVNALDKENNQPPQQLMPEHGEERAPGNAA